MKQHVLEALAAKSVGDLSPVFTARKGRAGCSPWEFAFGAGGGAGGGLGLGYSVAPLHMAVGG